MLLGIESATAPRLDKKWESQPHPDPSQPGLFSLVSLFFNYLVLVAHSVLTSKRNGARSTPLGAPSRVCTVEVRKPSSC